MNQGFKVVVSEGFHNVPPIALRIRGKAITPSQKNRLLKHMCGISDCGCQPQHGWLIEGMNSDRFLDLLRNI